MVGKVHSQWYPPEKIIMAWCWWTENIILNMRTHENSFHRMRTVRFLSCLGPDLCKFFRKLRLNFGICV